MRGGQLCGLKFRRQHPIGPYFTDFACLAHHIVIEIDGGYHDAVGEADLRREVFLRQHGWRVIRFSDKDVEDDVEAVGQAIASELGLDYVFKQRSSRGSGLTHESAPQAPKKSV